MTREDDAEIDLSAFDDEYASVPAGGAAESGPVPDGKYEVVVERTELSTARTSGSPMLKWMLRIAGPQCKGRVLWHHNVIGSRDNLRWLKADLLVCGVERAKLSELPGELWRLVDLRLEVTKRTRGDGEVTYLNKRLPAGVQPAASKAGADGKHIFDPVHLVIIGPPRTKKNHGRIVRVHGRPMVLPSLPHERWATSAILQLQAQWRRPALACPVRVEAVFHRERNLGDLVGFLQALGDALERARVLVDDRQIASWDGSYLSLDSVRPRIECDIYPLELAVSVAARRALAVPAEPRRLFA